jgi:outer membrane immunogenic protein
MRVGYRVIAFSSLCLVATAVGAADLKVKRPPPEPGFFVPAPAYSWTGYYIGGYVGGAHGLWTVDFFRNNNHGHAEEGFDGVAAGIYGGYNYQLVNNFVLGVEADVGFTSAKQSNNIFDNDTSLAKINAIGSVRGRLGYAFDRLLFYGTAGVAFANITNEIQKGRNAGEEVVWDDQFRIGFAVGGGAEYAFTNNLIGRVEYLYNNFGTVTLLNQDQNRAEFRNELHLLRAGLSYKF